MKTTTKRFLFLMLIFPVFMFGQTALTGTVTEQGTSIPLPGVNVIVQGTTNGTATDFDGGFAIEVNDGDVLVFSYVGYQQIEITYNGQSTLDVQLAEDTAQLDEVVIIGYGSVRKEDLTGSVDVVSSKEFNKGAVISADQLLNGKAPGVKITTAGGQPDAAPNIRIRGGASLSANSNPLIVIDGIAVDNTNPAGVSNPLTLVNPNDIESFSILKDASATAIYGSRASNGVIIITTKKGTSGEVKFNFSSSISSSSVSKKIDVFDGDQYVDFINSTFPQESGRLGVPVGSVDTSEPISQIINGRAIYNSEWQDAIYRTSFSSDHNFSARANLFDKIPFRGSIGYNNTEGIVKTNDYERITASIKLTPKLFDDHLKIDLNAKSIFVDKNSVDEGGALGGALSFDPTKPIFDNSSPFGGYYTNLNDQDNIDGASNPVALLLQRKRPEKVSKILGNIEFDYKMHFLPELRAVVNLGIEASEAKIVETFSDNALATYRLDNTNSDPGNDIYNYVFNPGENYRENQNITNTTIESYLAYRKEFENFFINNFDIQAGYGYQNFKNDGNKVIYRYNTETGLREIEPNESNPNNRYYNTLNLQSFFTRSNINIYNKYLITLSLRADGSSLFRKEERWGYFPAVALAWKLKEESFLQNSELVNDIKLRIGWGETGQQDITGIAGFYPSIPLFEAGSGTSQYLPGVPIYNAKPFNSNLTWEKTTTYNAGIDFDLFKNGLLSGAFDVFRRDTRDLLVDAPVGPGQGLTDVFPQNIGETKSEGFELNLNINPIRNENTNFSINGNVSYNRTEVVSLKDVTSINAPGSGLPTGTGVNLARHVVGLEAYSAWVFKQIYDVNGRPIPGAFVDKNGDGVINNDDRYYQPLRPNWTFGFGFSFNYKNWDISSSFRGQFDGLIYNAPLLTRGYTEAALPNNTQSLNNTLNFYSGAADDNIVDIRGNIPFSDYYLEDAAFLRCENIVLGYTFNELVKGSNWKFYAAVNNAFLITKYSGQDPENFNAIDTNFYPRPRVYSFGINVDF
ncbi:SusC/RagA family TonB-linked outer membrane protein [Tamlana sp. 2201CG12-4]|uniref:SusC/RagA family TonB-linked outer membrane protein n=1 Tax=Tamlana sp. 2201CG12-4 TaxID=3112582 RepID=UPI002DBCB937|nr:SusC/RagA family TonB-linked outer membrane protein [Tamlana sp. 2201CG12-4]MEC3906762.1 SusC/RagA family TonB-linked outer membrane protein [Tamlana sp. 2201CG12-4]